MKIALIGPGIMPIPPNGWGAVETTIWEYYNALKRIGCDVHIVNTPDMNEIIHTVNTNKFDVAHLHYDVFYPILDHLECEKIIFTSYYPFITNISKYNADGFMPIFEFITRHNKTYLIQCLSNEILNFLVSHGANKDNLFVLPNGANDESFKFTQSPSKVNRAIYLGKIEPRKMQYVYQYIDNIDFVGHINDDKFINKTNYIGHWSREILYQNLTEYGCLVLLSIGDASPLVCCEALMAGLGLVISKHCDANLDLNLPFITIIPDDKLDDLDYVEKEIKRTLEIAKSMRNEIRQYGISVFSFNTIVHNYMNIINNKKDT